MTNKFVLTDSSLARYVTGAMMYFAQGIPAGLLGVAIPAWMANGGVEAGDIASYFAIIVLPWAFKLLSGPIMDRYMFLAMGRRRPWVIGAQLGLSLSLLTLMLIDDPVEQVGLLTLIGVLINTFAATQDVAVDGMSIELTPTREQGRLNASMSFGKAIGWSVTAAVSGLMLTSFGMQATAIAASLVSAILLIAFLFVLERKGERHLPWSSGEAGTSKRDGSSFRDVFSGINKILWTRASMVVLGIMFFDGLISGYGHALMPIAAVKLFGYTTAQWSQLVAAMGLIGAVLALGMGPIIDRFGAKRMLILTVALVGAHALLIARTQHLWQDTTYVRLMLSVWVLMLPVVMVCVIALGMSICGRENAATQFAIYMSVANLGSSVGAKVYGVFSEGSSYVEIYTILSVITLVLVVVLFFHREERDKEDGETHARSHTVSLGGADGGVFWSGAMRCPKCRDDMQVINYQGTEIDRCNKCNGLWFDVGELELLKNTQAATALDTGSAREGKRYNKLDDYPCPRCNGEMLKMVDTEQKHIWYETCNDCEGSFFDAGEFIDLAEVTISDFFKRLKPSRGK